MSAPTPPPIVHRSRKWRFVRWLVVSVVTSFVAITLWNLVQRESIRIQGNRELAAAIAEADRDDPDWTWEKLNAARKRPPEGKNGAELIPKIKAASHADWGKWQAKDEWKSRLSPPPNERFSPKLLAEVRRDAEASAGAIALARTLKECPFGHREYVLTPNVLDTLLPDTQHTRHAADVLRWDVVLALEDRDPRRAADGVMAALAASRSIGDEPMLISQLIRMATRTVAVRSAERLLAQFADPPDLTTFQTVLAADAEEPLLLYGLRGDRAGFDRLIENLQSGVAKPENAIDSGFRSTQSRLGWWLYSPNLLADRADFLNWMSRAVAIARRPVDDQSELFALLPTPEKNPNRLLSGLLLPAIDRVSDAQVRSTAEARSAVVGIACERFRVKHNRWPNDLAELVPGFLAAVPLDPYSGEPLRFAKSDAGCVVFSVGKDRSGAAGEFDAPDPQPNTFARFRLWNPDRRRQPAPPDPPDPAPEP